MPANHQPIRSQVLAPALLLRFMLTFELSALIGRDQRLGMCRARAEWSDRWAKFISDSGGTFVLYSTMRKRTKKRIVHLH